MLCQISGLICTAADGGSGRPAPSLPAGGDKADVDSVFCDNSLAL